MTEQEQERENKEKREEKKKKRWSIRKRGKKPDVMMTERQEWVGIIIRDEKSKKNKFQREKGENAEEKRQGEGMTEEGIKKKNQRRLEMEEGKGE